MPVSQIIDYFNDQMRVAPMRFLPEDPIRLRYGAVDGYFGPLRLTSVFQPLVAIASSGHLVVGHQAYVRALGANHAALPVPEVFASARDVAAGDHFGRTSPDLSNAIPVPVDGRRPFGSRTAAGKGPVRAGDGCLRYA